MTDLLHQDGTLSMAREAPGTATADVFICSGPAAYLFAHPGAPGDNAGYAAFGQVVNGMDVVRAILDSPTGRGGAQSGHARADALAARCHHERPSGDLSQQRASRLRSRQG